MNGRTGIAILFIFLASASSWTFADEVETDTHTKAALQIIGDYGSGNQLTLPQLQAYLSDQAFQAIDLDKDAVLQFEEFRDARLYCVYESTNRKWDCDLRSSAIEQAYDAARQGSDITSESLLESGVRNWRPIIIQQALASWARSGVDPGDKLSVEQLAAILRMNAERNAQTLATKLNELVAAYRERGDTVSLDQLEIDILAFALASADKNASGSVDIFEFLKAFDGPSAVPDYNEFLQVRPDEGGVLVVEPDAAPLIASGAGASTVTRLIWQQSDLDQRATETAAGSEQRVSEVARVADEETESEADSILKKKVRRGPFGTAYVKDRGIVFPASAAAYDPKLETVAISDSLSVLTLRVVEDFTKAGSKANPGTISWSKDAGSSPDPNFGLAIRADWRIDQWNRSATSGWQMRPAFGLQYNRVGRGDDESDVRKAFLILDSEFGDRTGFIRSQRFQVGPVFEKDQVNRIDKLTGLIEWEPVVSLAGLTSGVFYQLSKDISWYVRPRLAIEVNDIRDQPEGSSAVDSNFYRYGAEIGIDLWQRASLTYEYKQRHATDDFDEDYHYQTAKLAWKLDDLGIFNLTLDFGQGRDTPSFERVEKYSLGLGVKY